MSTTTIAVAPTTEHAQRVLKFLAAGTGPGTSRVTVSNESDTIWSGFLSWNAPGDFRYIPIGDALGQVTIACENTKADGDVLSYIGLFEASDATLLVALANVASATQTLSAPLATILSSAPGLGAIAQPTDAPDGRLAWNGVKWIGFLGTFLTDEAVAAIPTTNLGQGAWLVRFAVGLEFWNPDTSEWLVTPITTPAPI